MKLTMNHLGCLILLLRPEVLQVPRTVDSLILSVLKGSQNVRKANVCIQARPSPAVYS